MNSKKVIITALIVFLIFNTSININNYAVDFISNQKDRENGVLIGAEPYEINKDPDTTVLLIHGTTSSPKDFKNTANYLASKNISVKAMLLPGHGTSPKDLETKTYQNWVNAVTIEVEKIGSKNKFLLGYSLGGDLALDAAEEFNLNGIILIHAPISLQSKYIPFIP